MIRSHLNAIENHLLAISKIPANAGHALHKGTPREAFIREFLIKHILQNVPVEKVAFAALVGFIISGSNTPAHLDKSLTATLPNSKLEKLSKSFFSSQRSGAISRMVDLGIVNRERDGVYVKYSLTPTSDLFKMK